MRARSAVPTLQRRTRSLQGRPGPDHCRTYVPDDGRPTNLGFDGLGCVCGKPRRREEAMKPLTPVEIFCNIEDPETGARCAKEYDDPPHGTNHVGFSHYPGQL